MGSVFLCLCVSNLFLELWQMSLQPSGSTPASAPIQCASPATTTTCSQLRVGNNKSQTFFQHIVKTMGSSYTVARDANSNISYSCQLVRGLYQTVSVQDVEFVNVRFPIGGAVQSNAFSVISEHRDVLSKIDASRAVAVTENGSWSEKKVKEALINRYPIDNSWFAVMCRTGNENLVRFNNVTLYAKCFHLLGILCDAADAGENIALPAAWAQYNTIDLTVAAAAAGIAEWNNAVTLNHLICFGDELSDSDILCLHPVHPRFGLPQFYYCHGCWKCCAA